MNSKDRQNGHLTMSYISFILLLSTYKSKEIKNAKIAYSKACTTVHQKYLIHYFQSQILQPMKLT